LATLFNFLKKKTQVLHQCWYCEQLHRSTGENCLMMDAAAWLEALC